MKGPSFVNLPNCTTHLFKQKQKILIAKGSCKVYSHPTAVAVQYEGPHFDIQKNSKLIRMKEISFSTYMFLNETDIRNGIYAISIPNADQIIQEFEEFVEQHLDLVDFYMLNPEIEIKQKINVECPLGQPGVQLGQIEEDKIDAVGEGIGSIFGGISSLFDTNKYNRESRIAMDKVSKDTFSEQTLSKWQLFKKKCSGLNDKMTEALKPVSEKCKEITDDIGMSFEKSDNSLIKGVREYSKKTEKALNKGYEEGDGSKTKNTEVSSQNSQTSVNERKSLL